MSRDLHLQGVGAQLPRARPGIRGALPLEAGPRREVERRPEAAAPELGHHGAHGLADERPFAHQAVAHRVADDLAIDLREEHVPAE